MTPPIVMELALARLPQRQRVQSYLTVSLHSLLVSDSESEDVGSLEEILKFDHFDHKIIASLSFTIHFHHFHSCFVTFAGLQTWSMGSMVRLQRQCDTTEALEKF